jgi:hypothetical protein
VTSRTRPAPSFAAWRALAATGDAGGVLPGAAPAGRHRARGAGPLLLLLGLCVARPARADLKELYTALGYEPAVSHYDLPASGSGSAAALTSRFDLSAYFGLTNAWHVGGRIRGSISSDVHLADARVNMPDGSVSSGDVYLDHRSVGIGALALYRLDTGLHLAPVLEVEAGFTSHQYRRIEHVPTGVAYIIPLSDVSETVFHGAAAVLVEYRFRNRWIAAAGVGVQVEPGASVPWSVNLPLRVGVIW